MTSLSVCNAPSPCKHVPFLTMREIKKERPAKGEGPRAFAMQNADCDEHTGSHVKHCHLSHIKEQLWSSTNHLMLMTMVSAARSNCFLRGALQLPLADWEHRSDSRRQVFVELSVLYCAFDPFFGRHISPTAAHRACLTERLLKKPLGKSCKSCSPSEPFDAVTDFIKEFMLSSLLALQAYTEGCWSSCKTPATKG